MLTRTHRWRGTHEKRARRRLSAESDERLIRAYAARGDAAAYTRLVDRNWPVAYRLAYRCLNDAGAAEDVAQEVFTRLARKATPSWELKGSFGPYLRTLVLNAVRDRAKTRGRRSRHEQQAARTRSRSDAHDVEASLVAGEVREHVSRLPDDVRSAVVLRYFEGCSHKDVAEVLGCKPGTASSRIRRGVEQLRESLATAGLSVTPTALVALLLDAPTPSVPPVPTAASSPAPAPALSKGVKLALAAAAAILVVSGATAILLGPNEGPAPLANAPAAFPGDPDDPGRAPAPQRAPGAGEDGGASTQARGGAEGGTRDSGGSNDDGKDPQGATKRHVDRTPVVVAGPGHVAGRVLDATTHAPIPGAVVFAVRKSGSVLSTWAPDAHSDDLGRYEIALDRYVGLETEADGAAGNSGRFLSKGTFRRWQEQTPVRDLVLVARAEGYAPLVRPITLAALRADPDLVLQPGGGSLKGRLLVRGTNAPAARVQMAVVVFPEVASDPAAGVLPRFSYASVIQTDEGGGFHLGGLPAHESLRVVITADQGYLVQTEAVRTGAPDQVIHVTRSARLVVEFQDESGEPCADVLEWTRFAGEPLVDPANVTEELDLSALDPAQRAEFMEMHRARKPTPLGSFKLLDAEGKEVAIDLRMREPGRAVLELPAGRYTACAAFPRAGAQRPGLGGFLLPDVTQTVTLAIGEEGRVVLRAPSSEGLGTLRVRLKANAAQQGLDETPARRELRLSCVGGFSRTIRTDSSGEAVLALPPGRYTVEAADDGVEAAGMEVETAGAEARLASSASADVKAGATTTVTLTIVKQPEAGEVLRGVVLDPDGDPVPGALVQGDTDAAPTDASGRFAVTVQAPREGRGSSVPERWVGVALVISAPGYLPICKRFAPDAQGEVRIVLHPGHTLEVKGALLTAVPPRTPVLAAFVPTSREVGPAQGEGLASGRAFSVTLEGLARGEPGVLVLRIGDFVPFTRRLGGADSSLDLGGVALDAGRTITGSLEMPEGLAPSEWAWWTAAPAGGFLPAMFRLELRPSGRFEVRGVPSGVSVDLLLGVDPEEDPEAEFEGWVGGEVRVDATATTLPLVRLKVRRDAFARRAYLESRGEPTRADGKSMRINMEVDGVGLGDMLEMIGRQVGVTLEVDPRLAERPVSVSFSDIEWKDVMKTLADSVDGRLEDLPGGGLRLVPK